MGGGGALVEPGSGGGGFSGMGITPNGSFAAFCFSFCTSALRLSGSVGGINSEAVTAATVGFCCTGAGLGFCCCSTVGFGKSGLGDWATGEVVGVGELLLSLPPPPKGLHPPIKRASVVKKVSNEI